MPQPPLHDWRIPNHNYNCNNCGKHLALGKEVFHLCHVCNKYFLCDVCIDRQNVRPVECADYSFDHYTDMYKPIGPGNTKAYNDKFPQTWTPSSQACPPRTAYDGFHKAREAFLADHITNEFPRLPNGCNKNECVQRDFNSGCQHLLRKLLETSGKYTAEWLKKERLQWHPDKFSGKGDGPKRATEIFQMMGNLLGEFAHKASHKASAKP